MHMGLSPFQETSCGHKENTVQMEFSHDWVLQKCLWIVFIVAFCKPRGWGLHAGLVAAASPMWWAGQCASHQGSPEVQGAGLASRSSLLVCIFWHEFALLLNPVRALLPTRVLPSAWRSNRFCDMLCKNQATLSGAFDHLSLENSHSFHILWSIPQPGNHRLSVLCSGRKRYFHNHSSDKAAGKAEHLYVKYNHLQKEQVLMGVLSDLSHKGDAFCSLARSFHHGSKHLVPSKTITSKTQILFKHHITFKTHHTACQQLRRVKMHLQNVLFLYVAL